MYEHILVATGGSPWSDIAVDYAELTVITVAPPAVPALQRGCLGLLFALLVLTGVVNTSSHRLDQ